MGELSHLDELEAEAIYIISILSGEAAISIPACKYHMEIQGNDSIP